ncbi:hypothetical protein PED40_14270 [Staphylococcus aureus]|uniref:hypothetical protein n=1 Tax=Staphylococcus aureus TaxID=1280 RepID=UPI0022E76D1E|nr:hypothetical protein [Staphylococcus aureus]MDA2904740.1 hypothetical protein [Staphylococcus aureus]
MNKSEDTQVNRPNVFAQRLKTTEELQNFMSKVMGLFVVRKKNKKTHKKPTKKKKNKKNKKKNKKKQKKKKKKKKKKK